jgi:hypothetical protein
MTVTTTEVKERRKARKLNTAKELEHLSENIKISYFVFIALKQV